MVIYKLTQSVCTSSFFFKTSIFLLISFFLVTCCLLFTRKYRIHRCPSMPMNGQTFWNSNKAITVSSRSYIFVSRFLILSFYSLSHIIKLILFKINILFFRNSMVVWQAIYFWNNIFYLCIPSISSVSNTCISQVGTSPLLKEYLRNTWRGQISQDLNDARYKCGAAYHAQRGAD